MAVVEAGAGSERTVDVRGVVKRYPLFGRRRDRALAFLGINGGIATKVALGGVDLDAGPGEAVGIIGENGSGKSTLLRVVAGITRPDAGSVEVAAPISAILELGLGFHPEFSGRENALLYGAVIGVPERVMRERLADVLAFAELGEFIDQPLRTYSSGMTARLAFAVATHVDPNVLLVDEALAVGDIAFQKKCVDRMARFLADRRTVLFCSHAMYLVTSFCQRAVWLRDGQVAAAGDVHGVVSAYEEYLVTRGKRVLTGWAESRRERPEVVAGSLRLAGIDLLDGDDRPIRQLAPGGRLTVRFRIGGAGGALPCHVGVAFDTLDGRCAFATTTRVDGVPAVRLGPGGEVRLVIDELPIASGSLRVLGFLFDETGLQLYDEVVLAQPLPIATTRWTPSLLAVRHRWEV
jgi:ABC-type polysaccharide/polyol phosphate transport system ATPase subunit